MASISVTLLSLSFGSLWINAVGLKSIAADLGGSRSAPSLANSLAWFGSSVGGLAMGRLADRYGIRWTVLFGGVSVCIGLFISTTTRNQIIAGGATFAVCLLLWVLDWVSSYEQAAWAKVIAYMSVVQHFEPFSKGVIDTKDVVFFGSLIFFGLFLTARSMESLRWRA